MLAASVIPDDFSILSLRTVSIISSSVAASLALDMVDALIALQSGFEMMLFRRAAELGIFQLA
jgi:hypothetical protein